MSEPSMDDRPKAREPYQPPMIEDVPLRTDEQVLAGCKGPGLPGAGHSVPAFACQDPRNGACVDVRKS
jgi:hypothetical protein